MMAGSGDGFSSDPQDMISASPIRVAFSRPLDSQPLGGDLVIDAYCWFDGIDSIPRTSPPQVRLLINGQEVASQWCNYPRFEIDAGYFKRGTNTIQLTARLAMGGAATTPVQTLTFDPPEGQTKSFRPTSRFTVFDPHWNDDITSKIQHEQNFRERAAAAFTHDGEATFNIPQELEGEFDLMLESRSQDLKSPAVATIRLKQGRGRACAHQGVPGAKPLGDSQGRDDRPQGRAEAADHRVREQRG